MPGTLLGSEIWWWPRQNPDSWDALPLWGTDRRHGNTRGDTVAAAAKPGDVTGRTQGARLVWSLERFCEEATSRL